MASNINRAEYYVVREIFFKKDDRGEWVVLDVQGVRGDGSYWVTGFQLEIPYQEWLSLNVEDIKQRVVREVVENELKLNQSELMSKESENKTREIWTTSKYTSLKGLEIRLGQKAIK